MSTFTVPSNLVAALKQLKERTELRDEQGVLVGVFTPPAARNSRWSDAEIAELEQVFEQEKHLGRPLEEIWRDLKAR